MRTQKTTSYNWNNLLLQPVKVSNQNHLVQFFDHSDSLGDSVSTWIHRGLIKGEGVMLIAVPLHWEIIKSKLASYGCKYEEHEAKGQLVYLDASQTLLRILSNGRIDADAFYGLADEIMVRMRKAFPAIRAYGEIVNLLWERNDVENVILLEDCWNHVLQKYSCSLLCGYIIKNSELKKPNSTLQRVCNLHSEVISPADVEGHPIEVSRNHIIALLEQKAAALETEIEERKKIEQTLREREEELRKSLKTCDDFLLLAAHELRAPMNALKVQLQMMERLMTPLAVAAPLVKKLLGRLTVSDRHIDHLLMLIDDLLDVSRMQAGKLTFFFEEVELSALVHDVFERFAETLAQANITVELQLSQKVHGNWDPFRIEQVIVNLISNVVKYAPSVSLIVSVKGNSDSAILRLEDSGVGIAKEEHERIFDQYVRIASSAKISGLGLGLSISKQIVESHGGTITVESEPGQGSAFIVKLPLNPPEQ